MTLIESIDVQLSRVESLSDRVQALSAALCIVTGWLILSLAGNAYQIATPSYSDSDRFALRCLISESIASDQRIE